MTEQSEIERIRKKAEKYDEEILRLISNRTKFPYYSRVYLNPDSNPDLTRDSCLLHYLNGFFAEVLSKVKLREQKKDTIPEHVFKLDREIAFKLMQRTTTIGYEVAKYKHPRGMPVYVKKVEERKIQTRIEQAKRDSLSLTDREIRDIFTSIFAETRRIEGINHDHSRSIEGIKSICN